MADASTMGRLAGCVMGSRDAGISSALLSCARWIGEGSVNYVCGASSHGVSRHQLVG